MKFVWTSGARTAVLKPRCCLYWLEMEYPYWMRNELKSTISKRTNERISKKHARTSVKELFKFLGLILIMREANPSKVRAELWSRGSECTPSLHLARFGMPLSRFNLLASAVSFVSLTKEMDKIQERQLLIDARRPLPRATSNATAPVSFHSITV